MRVSITIVTFLVVGSNASLLSSFLSSFSGILAPVPGLLGPASGIISPVANILASTSVVTQATTLFSSLNSRIGQAGATAALTVEGDLQEVTVAAQSLQTQALGVANRLVAQGVPGATNLVSGLTGSNSGVMLLVENLLGGLFGSLLGTIPNPTNLGSQINVLTASLQNQISGLVNPFIVSLGANVTSGNIKLQCFNNEVPEIQGNNSAVVAEVEAAFSVLIEEVVQQVDSVLADVTAKLNTLNTGLVQCGTNGTCQVQLISCITSNLVSNATGWVGESTIDATSDEAALTQSFAVIVNDFQSRLVLIQKDIVACA